MAKKMANDPEQSLSSLVPQTHADFLRDPRGRTPEQISYEQILRKTPSEAKIDSFLPDQNNVLFEPRLLNNEAERAIYKNELSSTVLTALGTAFREGTDLHGIYQDIHESKAADPNSTSLFFEIQTRLESLLEDPENFEVRGKKLTEAEVKDAINGLRVSRRILIKAAKAAGVFESLEKQIEKYQQNPDYEQAQDNLQDLTSNSERLQWEETISLNRASPDFGGISLAYINGALFNMDYYLAQAKVKYFGEMAQKATDPNIKQEYENFVVANKQIVDALENDRFLLNWGKPRPNLENQAAVYLKEQYEPKAEVRPTNVITTEDREGVDRMRGRSGYNGVVQAVKIRARLNPEAFDQSLASELAPVWFEGLSPENQAMVRSILHINWIAATKRDTGALTFEDWSMMKGLRIERNALKNMWEKMPGFRVAMATLTKDIFEEDNDEFKIISGVEGKGYDIVGDQKKFEDYKERKINELKDYLKLQPEAQIWAKDHFGSEVRQANALRNQGDEEGAQKIIDEVYKKIATVSVSTVDNLLFATGAYDSGNQFVDLRRTREVSEAIRQDPRYIAMPDYEQSEEGVFLKLTDEQRERYLGMSEDERKRYKETLAVKINGTSVASDAIRALFQPGQKGIDKWSDGIAYAGSLGSWAEDNLRHNREVIPGVPFGEALKMTEEEIESGRYSEEQKEKIREIRNYLPRRMFYSVLELTELKDRDEGLAELLLKGQKNTARAEKKSIAADGTETVETANFDGLYDYEGGADFVDMDNIKVDELWGDYQDLGSAVIAVYGHMTASGGGPRDGRLNKDALIKHLIKIKKNDKLRDLYNDKGFLKSAIGLVISPEGFELGQPDLLLAVPEGSYNLQVTSVLMDTRFWAKIPNGGERRRELFKAYQAKDINNIWNLLYDIYIEGTFIAPRGRKRNAIINKTAQEILQFEEEERLKEEKRKRKQAQQTP